MLYTCMHTHAGMPSLTRIKEQSTALIVWWFWEYIAELPTFGIITDLVLSGVRYYLVCEVMFTMF